MFCDVFWSTHHYIVTIVVHAAAARDPILSTQRMRKVKISMVGIYKVKVRLHHLALAHVSHFFPEREPWALKQSTRFAVFVISQNSSSSAVLLPLAPASLFVQLFDAFSALSSLFVTLIPCFQDGSAASLQVDMQIEAAARLKNTLSDLPALEISRSISFGAPPHIFSQTTFVVGFVN